ncbi:unnamed protein product [Allacma fusca]|uniref:Citrate transporter-like domain-containing protein n=1 Tax=Allacma fusca TaxID=39272 RepID=A0A8J2KHQ2_9HEXA|nr:unnamed protein product [Allacma fusca]
MGDVKSENSKDSIFTKLSGSFAEMRNRLSSSAMNLLQKRSEGDDQGQDDELPSYTDRSHLLDSRETFLHYGSMGTGETFNDEFDGIDDDHPLERNSLHGSSPFLPMTPLSIHIDDEDNITSSPAGLPGNGLEIPTINISQDFNFLTVDTRGHGSGSSGFLSEPWNQGPISPTPTFASSFEFQHQPSKKFSWKRTIKISTLAIIYLLAAALITANNEKKIEFFQVTTQEIKPFQYPVHLPLPELQTYPILSVTVKGSFVPDNLENVTETQLIISVEKQDENNNIIRTVSKKWRLGIVVGENSDTVSESVRTTTFNLADINLDDDSKYALVFRTNSQKVVPFALNIRLLAEGIENGAIYGGAILIGLYILIIFEVINRTLSAMLAAATAIGVLSLFNERPTTEEMVSWLDMDTLILLFSMMVMMAVFCETGFFDYSAYIMYKVTNGQVWPLITGLCIFTALVSAFLDNVTTVLLMTPVTIRICEAMTLNPVPVLISIVIFSNIGGAMTPVGDPPNVIIANNPKVLEAGVDFSVFALHMLLGIIPVIIVAYIQLRIIFRSMKSLQFSEPYEVAELRREIEVWLRAADSLSSYSKDEGHVRTLLLAKIRHLKGKLKTRIRMGGQSEENYKQTLLELELSCKIRDWPLLIKSGIVLTACIIMFFLHSFPQLNLSLGWTALLGAILLLVLADRRELEGIFTRVEWSTLIFFSALFIVMEAVSRLGLLKWIGQQTEEIVLNVNPESRLTVAIVIILWVSGIASAFIDNIPFTTMMIQIVTSLAERINLPLQPLVWALAFGTCLGGNGTLIGASANVVCAGVADQHGYRFTFIQYFKIGFPMMIVSLIVSNVYLLICHTALKLVLAECPAVEKS